MGAVAFDTLKLARRLRDTAHMPAEQAEGIADALAEAMSGAELATRADIAALSSEVAAVRTELGHFATKADLSDFKAEVKADLAEMRVMLSHFAAKADLSESNAEIKAEFAEMRVELGRFATKADLAEVRADLAEVRADLAEMRVELAEMRVGLGHFATRADLAENKTEILRWMFAAVVAQTALIVGLIRFLGH